VIYTDWSQYITWLCPGSDKQLAGQPQPLTIHTVQIVNSFIRTKYRGIKTREIIIYTRHAENAKPQNHLKLRWPYIVQLNMTNVCLIYCMRRMCIYSVKWPTMSNNVFTNNVTTQKKFSPWNFATLIVFLPCHSAILTCTSVHFYCEAYLMMRINSM